MTVTFWVNDASATQQCLQENLQNIAFEQCSELANQVGNRAHRLCSETIPADTVMDEETVLDEETNQGNVAQ